MKRAGRPDGPDANKTQQAVDTLLCADLLRAARRGVASGGAWEGGGLKPSQFFGESIECISFPPNYEK